MKKIFIVTVVLIFALLVVPSLADTQTAVGTQVGGSHNSQIVTNTNDQQSSSGVQIGGADNNIYNTNINTNGGSITTGAASVSNDQSVVINMPQNTYDNSLAIENTNMALTTLYAGQAITIPMGNMRAGWTENLTWISGSPVLVYVISTSDTDAILHDVNMMPAYDDVYQYYDHGGVFVYPSSYDASVNEGMSRQNQIVFTAPEDGYYSFVVDTRPSICRNTRLTGNQLSDNMVDFAYSMQYAGYIPQKVSTRSVIGVTSTFAVTSDGTLITS